MQMYPWRRSRPSHASCVSGCETGVNYTSHHLRCGQIEALGRHAQCTVSKPVASSSWPGTAPLRNEDEDSYSNVFTPQPKLRYSYDSSLRPSTRSRPSSVFTTRSGASSIQYKHVSTPPRCRLPHPMRFTTLLLYLSLTFLVLTSTTIAAPPSYSHAQLHRRQAIPDRFGNTGNEPAPVASQPEPRPFTPTASVASIPSDILTQPSMASAVPTISSSSTPAPVPTTPLATNTPTTGTNGNSNPPPDDGNDPGLGEQPNNNRPDAERLTLTSPGLDMSPGAIAGIAGGAFVVLALIIGVGIWVYRRHHRVEVSEIPIRRSKLGSRLGFRIFGDSSSRAASRASSRRGSEDALNEKDIEARGSGWLDKGTISKPKAAFLENGLLGVPKPGFMREEREKGDVNDSAPWVDKGTISAPRPGRPASAEPLGRLSGMGLGMGYLK